MTSFKRSRYRRGFYVGFIWGSIWGAIVLLTLEAVIR